MDLFLEIGSGLGILTLRLASRVSRLVAIEIDRDLVAELTPKLSANASIIAGDVFEVDFESVFLSRHIVVRVVGNLPYNIFSPILFRILEFAFCCSISDATLMLQREVVDRIFARSGTPEFGVLSVLVQWWVDVARLLTIPSGAFRSPPDVRSALIRVDFRLPPLELRDSDFFERMVCSVFIRRCKILFNALGSFADQMIVSPAGVLAAVGIDPIRRPEMLEVIEFARLVDMFAAAKA